jgi:cytochrome c oxidase subunit 1
MKFFNWIGTMWRGTLTFETPMLFSLGFLVTFLLGGLSGVILASPPADFHVTDSYFVVAHFHYVLFGTIVFAVFAGVYFWFPKMFGRMLDDRLGRFHFWVTFIGTYLIYFPMHYLGVLGMPRRYYNFDNYAFIPPSAHALNTFITVVALVVGAAQLVYVFNLVWSAFRGRVAGANPWRAASLEWFTPNTPPVHGNWGAQLPVVHRWAYAYGVPGATEDFIPQNAPLVEGGVEAQYEPAPPAKAVPT